MKNKPHSVSNLSAMDCKEFNKNIKGFISNELDIHTLKRFLEHLDACEECREELEINYLVEKALIDIDSSGSYNLDEMLREHISSSEYSVYRFMRVRYIATLLEFSSGIISIIFILFFFSGYLL